MGGSVSLIDGHIDECKNCAKLKLELQYARAERDVVTRRMIVLEQRNPQWISVKRRLPAQFQPVLCCRKGNIVEQGYRDVDDAWKIYGARCRNVTHWMPLPAPPEVLNE